MSIHISEFRQLVEAEASKIANKPAPRKRERDELSYDIFTKEAYRIYQHIESLRRFLLSIRRPYLNNNNSVISRSTSHRPTTMNLSVGEGGESSLFSLFPMNIHHLTDNERDEIDFQAKLIIRRCIDRIKELEEADKIRREKMMFKPGHFINQILSVLQNNTNEDVILVHHSSITWLLNKKLMEVSMIQKEQQEIRLNREIEQSENLLSKSMYVGDPMATTSDIDTIKQEEDEVMQILESEHLSKEQIQMLEKENSMMLDQLNSTLNQVKSAEKALLEISTLQTQLTNHLAVQTIQTDRLYADAISINNRVEQGNRQLVSAKERNKGSRKFMLAFLLGASFVLLFLDWYS
ncbi:hypothetical protein BDB01DRAFT_842216 [Pilobolus umbonatus]|nr:hypothetical protein BDB01DRAFT_842216 [Pilobolus umbonatus]